jgi:4-hydroxybutyrate CoA-transferase
VPQAHSVGVAICGTPGARGDPTRRRGFHPDLPVGHPVKFVKRLIPLDVALLQVSPPDAHGYCTLGTSVDAALAAYARCLIAEINDRMPRTHGNTLVPFSRIHAFVHTSRALHPHETRAPNVVEEPIGENIAALVEDGATLQMGIGAIPDAALRRLHGKQDLGVHTEMFSDGVIDLVKSGAIARTIPRSSR